MIGAKKEPDPIGDALTARGLARQYHAFVKTLVTRAGIGAPGAKGDKSRLYVAELAAYYLGKGAAPIPPRELNTVDVEQWAKRRVWQELEERSNRLPALEFSRQPR